MTHHLDLVGYSNPPHWSAPTATVDVNQSETLLPSLLVLIAVAS